MLATKPTPQASCSWVGLYKPWARGAEERMGDVDMVELA
jgi:hypothetical protein